jgi:hypothetical protein
LLQINVDVLCICKPGDGTKLLCLLIVLTLDMLSIFRQFIDYMYHLHQTTWCALNTSFETQSVLPEEQSPSLWRDTEEYTLGPFADAWLSCDSNSEALSLACRLLSLRLITLAWIGVFPSSMLTTNDIDGLRVADVFVHKNAKLSILMASSVEYLEPRRLGSTNSKMFPCSWRS